MKNTLNKERSGDISATPFDPRRKKALRATTRRIRQEEALLRIRGLDPQRVDCETADRILA